MSVIMKINHYFRGGWWIILFLLLIACDRVPDAQHSSPIATATTPSPAQEPTQSPLVETSSPTAPSLTVGPSPRYFYAMTYDTRRQVTILFGGLTKDGLSNETWEYDGNQWRQIETPETPTPRGNSVMAYDPILNKTVLYGGGDDLWLEETWEYDGQTWQLIEMASPPALYEQGAMAYFPERGGLILFGGLLLQTWQYVDHTWVPLNVQLPVDFRMIDVSLVYDNWRERLVLQPNHNGKFVTLELDNSGDWYISGEGEHLEDFPGERTFVSTAFDNQRGVTILFGGALAGDTNAQDTWEYDGMSWRKVNPLESPSVRYGHRMVYDEARELIVLFGGSIPGPDGVPLGDTWEYDGATWVRRDISTGSD